MEEERLKKLGDVIRLLREAEGLSQEELAKVLGVSSSPVCSTNRPLDFIEFQAVFIFLRANFGQKKKPPTEVRS